MCMQDIYMTRYDGQIRLLLRFRLLGFRDLDERACKAENQNILHFG